MTSSTTKKEPCSANKKLAEDFKELDAKFWQTIEYEKNLFRINRLNTGEEFNGH